MGYVTKGGGQNSVVYKTRLRHKIPELFGILDTEKNFKKS